MKPRVFIGSSVEGLDVAYAVQETLDYTAECTVWSQGIFQLSSNTLDDLINSLDKFDFSMNCRNYLVENQLI
ncbi:MAG: TIR domain-containing protein [Crocosphaera sp.]